MTFQKALQEHIGVNCFEPVGLLNYLISFSQSSKPWILDLFKHFFFSITDTVPVPAFLELVTSIKFRTSVYFQKINETDIIKCEIYGIVPLSIQVKMIYRSLFSYQTFFFHTAPSFWKQACRERSKNIKTISRFKFSARCLTSCLLEWSEPGFPQQDLSQSSTLPPAASGSSQETSSFWNTQTTQSPSIIQSKPLRSHFFLLLSLMGHWTSWPCWIHRVITA